MGLRQVHLLFGAPILSFTIPRSVVEPGRLIKPMVTADNRRRRACEIPLGSDEEAEKQEGLRRTPVVRELWTYLEQEILPGACRSLGYDHERCRLAIADMFARVDRPGEAPRRPEHRHSRLSGVYSVQGGGELVFHRDGMSREAIYVEPGMIRSPTESNQPCWRVPAVEGGLLMFPGYVQQTVEPNRTREPRISVGFTTTLVRVPT